MANDRRKVLNGEQCYYSIVVKRYHEQDNSYKKGIKFGACYSFRGLVHYNYDGKNEGRQAW